MPNYKEMYFQLAAKVANAVDILPAAARFSSKEGNLTADFLRPYACQYTFAHSTRCFSLYLHAGLYFVRQIFQCLYESRAALYRE